MLNPEISAKKKFSILKKLLNNQKFSSIPPLIDGNLTIKDPKQQSDVLNTHFAAKSTVPNPNEAVPYLEQKQFHTHFDHINTSPLQVAKIIRSTLKKSHISHCGIPGKYCP